MAAMVEPVAQDERDESIAMVALAALDERDEPITMVALAAMDEPDEPVAMVALAAQGEPDEPVATVAVAARDKPDEPVALVASAEHTGTGPGSKPQLRRCDVVALALSLALAERHGLGDLASSSNRSSSSVCPAKHGHDDPASSPVSSRISNQGSS